MSLYNPQSYSNYPETSSCYLDGRYFNKVFEDYPGLIKEPLNIMIKEVLSQDGTEYQEQVSIYMRAEDIDRTVPGLLRVIIETQISRHSNLLILDYSNRIIYRLEPLGPKAQYFNEVNELIEKYLGLFLNFELRVIDMSADLMKNPECSQSGYCVACIIMFAQSFLNNAPFDPSNLRQYSAMIEQQFGPLPTKGADIEMGLFDRPQGGPGEPNPRGALVGGLGGAALGGLAFGGPGLVLGGLGGAAIGSTI